MGRGRNGQVVMQTKSKNIRAIDARKGQETQSYLFSKQKKGKTMQVSDNLIEHLKKWTQPF